MRLGPSHLVKRETVHSILSVAVRLRSASDKRAHSCTGELIVPVISLDIRWYRFLMPTHDHHDMFEEWICQPAARIVISCRTRSRCALSMQGSRIRSARRRTTCSIRLCPRPQEKGLPCSSIRYVIAMSAAVGRLPSYRQLRSPTLKRLQLAVMALSIPSAVPAHRHHEQGSAGTALSGADSARSSNASVHPFQRHMIAAIAYDYIAPRTEHQADAI